MTNSTKRKRGSDSLCREQFTAFSFDENDLLYLDDRLVIPKLLQCSIKVSLHWDTQVVTKCSDKSQTFGAKSTPRHRFTYDLQRMPRSR